jgi:hypothetical protein
MKRIVCLACSHKLGGLCIAGREVLGQGFGGWVRPISARDGSEVSFLEYRYEDFTSPQLLDLIDVPVLGPSRHGHQTENFLIDASRRWVKRGRAAFRRLADLQEMPESLWVSAETPAAGQHHVSREAAAGFDRSLYLVQAGEVEIEVVRGFYGEKSFRAAFTYGGALYRWSVTDCTVRAKYDEQPLGSYALKDVGEIFLCLSLTEPFAVDRRCHKLVAAVIAERSL